MLVLVSSNINKELRTLRRHIHRHILNSSTAGLLHSQDILHGKAISSRMVSRSMSTQTSLILCTFMIKMGDEDKTTVMRLTVFFWGFVLHVYAVVFLTENSDI